MTYWTVIGWKLENLGVIPLLKTRDINPVRKRHEARMARGKKRMTHKYTIEMIFHFTCSQCKNWWSIADTHHKDKNFYAEGRAYCPHCGKESITEKMNPIS